MNRSPNPMLDDKGAAQGLSPNAKKIIILNVFFAPMVGFIIFFVYGSYENYCPSGFVYEYGPFVWMPLVLGYMISLGYFMFAHRDTIRDKKISTLKRVAAGIALSVISLFLIRTTIIHGVPALINRIVGEPFQSQTVVTAKRWSLRSGPFPRSVLELANFETSIYTSEPVWKEVEKGDVVAVSGVQSIFGQAIHTVIKPPAPASEIASVESKTDMEPTDHTSAAQSSSQKANNDKLLLSASETGDFFLAALVVRQGADVNVKDKDGRGTAFLLACAFGHWNIAELLEKKGAKIDEPNIYGTTPLIIASLAGKTAVVKFLLNKGANVNARDKLGNTPLLAAKKKSLKPQPEIVKLLEERGAQE